MSLYDSLPENSFIKKVLLGVDMALVDRFLQIKKQYETTQDKEEKRLFRDKFTGVFWELYTNIARMITPELGTAKRLFLRYGLVDLRYLSPEDQKFILAQEVRTPNYDTDVIYYADEWLQGILLGKIKASAGDETENKQSVNLNPVTTSSKQEKFISLINIEEARSRDFKTQRSAHLATLSKYIENLQQDRMDEVTGISGIFDKEQLKQLDEIIFLHKEIKKFNKEIQASARTIDKARNSLDEVRESAVISTQHTSNSYGIIESEVANIRQMWKMTIGRKGNPFPILTSSIINTNSENYLFKNIVQKRLNHWIGLDPEVFKRTYKDQDMNIMPYMILVPGYGVSGACWEALDMDNKQFGRGRIALPIFTRTPDLALLTAMGDIRWQTAKEIASYYWMEEGLTGRYYEYYLEAKLKTDLRTTFITDYLLWMTKETQGVQKLEQNARYVFWRYVPLPDEDKIRLSKKGYYYNQLWEKEQVWRKGQK